MAGSKKIFFIILLVILCCAGGFYAWQQQKKHAPEYSLVLLQTAIAEHNWKEVQKRIDLDTFNGQVFTDVVAPTLQQSNNPALNSLMKNVADNIRSKFITSVNAYLQASVEVRNKPATLPEQYFARSIISSLDVEHFTLDKITKTTITGDTAIVDLTIKDDYLNCSLPISITMKKLPDGTWQIVKPNDTVKFLALLVQAQEAKLAVINEPLAAELAKAVTLDKGTFTLKVRHKSWLSTALQYDAKVNFISGKVVKEFIGQIRVYDKEKKLLYEQKYIKTGNFLPGASYPYHLSWTLNPAVPEEKIMIDSKLADLTFKENLVKITFADNTTVELWENLPH